MGIFENIVESVLTEISSQDAYIKFYSNIDKDIFDTLMRGVPKLTPFHTLVLNSLYVCKNEDYSQQLEFAKEINGYWLNFDNIKRQELTAKAKSLNKRFISLYDIRTLVKDVDSSDIIMSKNDFSSNGYHVLYQTQDIKVTCTTTYSANRHYFGNTQWCTASDLGGYNNGYEMFLDYTLDSKRKYVACVLLQFDYGDGTLIQASCENNGNTCLICDKEDHAISFNEIFKDGLFTADDYRYRIVPKLQSMIDEESKFLQTEREYIIQYVAKKTNTIVKKIPNFPTCEEVAKCDIDKIFTYGEFEYHGIKLQAVVHFNYNDVACIMLILDEDNVLNDNDILFLNNTSHYLKKYYDCLFYKNYVINKKQNKAYNADSLLDGEHSMQKKDNLLYAYTSDSDYKFIVMNLNNGKYDKFKHACDEVGVNWNGIIGFCERTKDETHKNYFFYDSKKVERLFNCNKIRFNVAEEFVEFLSLDCDTGECLTVCKKSYAELGIGRTRSINEMFQSIVHNVLNEISTNDAYTKFYNSIDTNIYNTLMSGVDKMTPFHTLVLNCFLNDRDEQKQLSVAQEISKKWNQIDTKQKQELVGLAKKEKRNIKTIDDASRLLDSVLTSNSSRSKNNVSSDGYIIVYENENVFVTCTTTYMANKHYFGHTEWCTASDLAGDYNGYEMFLSYVKKTKRLINMTNQHEYNYNCLLQFKFKNEFIADGADRKSSLYQVCFNSLGKVICCYNEFDEECSPGYCERTLISFDGAEDNVINKIPKLVKETETMIPIEAEYMEKYVNKTVDSIIESMQKLPTKEEINNTNLKQLMINCKHNDILSSGLKYKIVFSKDRCFCFSLNAFEPLNRVKRRLIKNTERMYTGKYAKNMDDLFEAVYVGYVPDNRVSCVLTPGLLQQGIYADNNALFCCVGNNTVIINIKDGSYSKYDCRISVRYRVSDGLIFYTDDEIIFFNTETCNCVCKGDSVYRRYEDNKIIFKREDGEFFELDGR